MVLVLDTDPGVDDMLALLLLLSAPKEQELRMITLTYGNCSLKQTLDNLLSLFYVLKQENDWRSASKLPLFSEQCPFVFLGASKALTGEEMPHVQEQHALSGEKNEVDATDVHGSDGLAGIHAIRPEFDAPKRWFNFFNKAGPDSLDEKELQTLPYKPGFQKPAWTAILDLLRSEPENTVTIMAVGPLTNLAIAAAIDPETFCRVKEVLSMGAALQHPGNVTPVAEFNVFTDPLAAAIVYGLTSSRPKTVMPTPTPLNLVNFVPKKPLNLALFALDLTNQHALYKRDVETEIGGVLQRYPKSVLAQWVYAWLTESFANYASLVGKEPEFGEIHLHDPLTAAYALDKHRELWEVSSEDVRVETMGQWSLGQTIKDSRGRAKSDNNPYDLQKWLTYGEGNNVLVVKDSPIKTSFSKTLMKRIVGL